MNLKSMTVIGLLWLIQTSLVLAHEGHDHSNAPPAAAASSGAGSFIDQLAGSGVAGIGSLAAMVLLVGVVGVLLVVAFGSRR